MGKLRIHSKYIKDYRNVRALCAFILKNFYHLKTDEIFRVLGDISSANASKLFVTGLKLVEENEEYEILIDELKKKYIV